MTPFNIRKRLKDLLGLGGGSGSSSQKEAAPRERVTLIIVDGESKEESVQADAGSTFVYAASNMARPLDTGCADATCATCRVEILEGEENLSPQSPTERSCLTENKHSDELRLGCQAQILKGTVKARAFELIDMG